MKYVALLSGGKDSCYNLLHCAKNGHELVAAASLGPEQGKEELDSYLYQTVGQDAIEFVGRALDVPLYRRIISGAAIEQGGEYGGRDPAKSGGTSGDETEDLYELLVTVKTNHPEIQGVSVGAILSNYQRVRVEHVCRRLGLTPLCYLWQRDQQELLSEMIDAGMEAVLIKVAGIGLTAKHLGKTLAQMQPTLLKLNLLYGSHVCGEGGEYETLTLDCPLFKRRIHLDNVETVVHSDSDFATVAYLRIKTASLLAKDFSDVRESDTPPILLEPFARIETTISSYSAASPIAGDTQRPITNTDSSVPLASTRRHGRWVAVANVQHKADSLDLPLEDEVHRCFEILKRSLAEQQLTLANCANINIFLSSMSLFARVNAIYATYFGSSPPARACVALDLPPGVRVRLDCVAYTEYDLGGPPERQALHVQGLSYWAPANIGPYSQAIVVDERVFVSGQIGLIPSSLALPAPPSLATETALAFQHTHRVVEALKSNSGGGWAGHAQGIIYWLANREHVAPVRAAAMQYEQDPRVPTVFAVVSELPRGALVEKQVLFHTGRFEFDGDDDEPTVQRDVAPVYSEEIQHGEFHCQVASFEYQTDSSSTARAKVVLVCWNGSDPQVLARLRHSLSLMMLPQMLSVRLFHTASAATALSTFPMFVEDPTLPATSIPCRYLSSSKGDDWDYAALAIST